MNRFIKPLLLGLLLIYILLQYVGPKTNYSHDISFDNRCYTGNIPYMDVVGSTCASDGWLPISFPFVINNAVNNTFEQILTALIDIGLPLVALVLYRKLFKNTKPIQ